MIPQTYAAAFITACLVAGSQAGPCKPSSRITEGFSTSDVSTTLGSTTASSLVETTTVAASSTYFSNEESSVIVTESTSSTETSVDPKETSTTALSTAEGTTTEIATTTDAATTTEAATDTATTTTSEASSAVPFIRNAGFDDDDSSVAPWETYYGEYDVSIASDVKHDGRNSALMAATLGGNSSETTSSSRSGVPSLLVLPTPSPLGSMQTTSALLLRSYAHIKITPGRIPRLLISPRRQASGRIFPRLAPTRKNKLILGACIL
ncbi:hypothetical protein NW765_005716 [Fusarium oxysporum]|nr:hypothetical protein NW765_005716 [Fusarium oxysporum]